MGAVTALGRTLSGVAAGEACVCWRGVAAPCFTLRGGKGRGTSSSCGSPAFLFFLLPDFDPFLLATPPAFLFFWLLTLFLFFWLFLLSMGTAVRSSVIDGSTGTPQAP